MKDPAFLFYSSDFLTGVIDLTMEERGQYITLLCVQHSKGRLTEKAIKAAVGEVSKDVLSKFKKDESELYYSPRLEHEIEKRRKHSAKQRNNVNQRWGKDTNSVPNDIPNEYQSDTTDIPLENENINENRNIDENDSEGKIIMRVREIVEYLNLKAETKYRATGKATQKHINARLKEGYTVEDFKTVIDKKVAEWVGTEFEKYLRPETLFGSKFENYLNQKAGAASKGKKSSNPFLDMLKEGEKK
jgi:uncharacterized phage protein (TIGR02220 family)